MVVDGVPDSRSLIPDTMPRLREAGVAQEDLDTILRDQSEGGQLMKELSDRYRDLLEAGIPTEAATTVMYLHDRELGDTPIGMLLDERNPLAVECHIRKLVADPDLVRQLVDDNR